MNQAMLQETLRLHKLWLDGTRGGVRADLTAADLRDADLRGADLRDADLAYANLSDADLRDVIMSDPEATQ